MAGKDSSLTFWAQPEPFRLDEKKTDKLREELIPRYLRPSGTPRKRGEIFKTFEIFRLPPGSTVILLSDGGKRMPTNRDVDVKFASKLDFCAEALVAHPCLGIPDMTLISNNANSG